MRFTATLLFLALSGFGVYTLMDAPNHYWWLSDNASPAGPGIDRLFRLMLYVVGFFFVLAEGLLIYFAFARRGKRSPGSSYTRGNHRIEMLWTAVPALLLLFIAFSQGSDSSAIELGDGRLEQAPPGECTQAECTQADASEAESSETVTHVATGTPEVADDDLQEPREL